MTNDMEDTKTTRTHMAFFWGKNGEILFSGWPGNRTGMYMLALASIFVISFLAEWLYYREQLTMMMITKPRRYSISNYKAINVVAESVVHTLVHAFKVCLDYTTMLAVMSFNAGVFLAAVVGRAVGFLVFRSEVFGERDLTLMPPYERASGTNITSPST